MKKEENLEKKVHELEKSNRWMKGILLTLVGVFFIALCIGFGFVIGRNTFDNDEDINKEQTNEEIDEKENEIEKELPKLDINSDVVKSLFEVFREDKDCASCTYWDEYSDTQAKKYIAYKELDESDFNEVRCGDLDDSYIDGLYCAMNDESMQYYGEDESRFENAIRNEKTSSVSEDVLKAKYKEIFGQDAIMKNEDFSIGYGPILHYDKEKKLYAKFSCECGGECAGVTQTLDNISQDGTKLFLSTTVVENIDRETEYSVVYTFEFEESTGNYIFVSREKK